MGFRNFLLRDYAIDSTRELNEVTAYNITAMHVYGIQLF